jgi:hypothetical protein
VASNLEKTKTPLFLPPIFVKVLELHQKLNPPSEVIAASLFPPQDTLEILLQGRCGQCDYASLKKSFDEVTELMLTL